MQRNYGWKPDVPDARDYRIMAPVEMSLPEKVDLRLGCSPVEDQGQLGSCTGNALVGCLEYLEKKDGLPVTDLSRLFVYYQERAMEGTINSDSGAQIRDGIKALATTGVCSEKLWAYDISMFRRKPSKKAYADAKVHTITEYRRLATVREMKMALAAGFPFVFGFSVYESFESEAVAKTGIMPCPGKGERLLGGHAVAAVGYDDQRGVFIVRNSWGSSWGDEGYFYMPQTYLANRDLSDDCWVIMRGNNL